MSNAKQVLIEKLEDVRKGLYLMSEDRERALSNHETVDLIERLRGVVAEALAEAQKLQN